jgi:hypothetical protein
MILFPEAQAAALEADLRRHLGYLEYEGYRVGCVRRTCPQNPTQPARLADLFPACPACGERCDALYNPASESEGDFDEYLFDLVMSALPDDAYGLHLRVAFLPCWAVVAQLAGRDVDVQAVYDRIFAAHVAEAEPNRYWAGALHDGLTSLALLAGGRRGGVGGSWTDVSEQVTAAMEAANPGLRAGNEFFETPSSIFMALRDMADQTRYARAGDQADLAAMALALVVVSMEDEETA